MPFWALLGKGAWDAFITRFLWKANSFGSWDYVQQVI